MEALDFINLWDDFDKKLFGDLNAPERIQLFGIYFEAHQKQQQMENMGLGNLMNMVTSQLQKDIKKSDKDDDWRGEEH